MPSQRTEETGSLSRSEERKLQRLYSGSGASAYGSLEALRKTSKLSRNKVYTFLHKKGAFTKFRQATRNFQRLKVHAKYIDEIWCMDLAYVDKLAKFNGNVKYLMVCVDVFSRFIRVQPMKAKYASDAKSAFNKMLKNGHQPKKLWVDQGTEFQGVFKTFCKTVGIGIYSTHSETKAALAERAIRSLKNILYRYMEDAKTDRYLPKLQQFVSTMNSRINRSIGKCPSKVTNKDVFSMLYKLPVIKHKDSKFKVGNYVRISKQDIPFRKGYKSQFTNEIFKVVAIATEDPFTYTLKDEDDRVIRGKFYAQELVRVII